VVETRNPQSSPRMDIGIAKKEEFKSAKVNRDKNASSTEKGGVGEPFTEGQVGLHEGCRRGREALKKSKHNYPNPNHNRKVTPTGAEQQELKMRKKRGREKKTRKASHQKLNPRGPCDNAHSATGSQENTKGKEAKGGATFASTGGNLIGTR